MRISAGLALLALLLSPVVADAQETCTSLSSFEWPSIATSVPPGQWGGCTPDAGDQYVIAGGHTVQITGAIVFSPIGTQARLSVENGGTLEATPPGRLTVGYRGLRVLEGGRFMANGRYHSFGVVPAEAEPARDADNFWEVDAVIPCPDAGGVSNCVTSPANVVRLILPATIESPDDGRTLDGALADSLAAMAVGDSLCFFARDRTRVRDTPAEDGFCYDIVGVGSAGPLFHLDIDVRQGVEDPVGMPLTRRDVQETSTLGAVAIGDRCVDLPDGLITEDQLYASRWLRWDGQSTAHRIAMTLADVDCNGVDTSATTGSDSVLIASRRGFPEAISAGTTLRIDYGFRPGDSFFVMRPFVIDRAVGLAEGTAPIIFDSEIDIQATVFRQVGGISLGFDGPPNGSLVIDAWRDIWAVDSGVVNLFILADESHITLEHTTGTGGDEGAGTGTHGFTVRGVTGLTLRDVALRYTGDDCLAVNQSFGSIPLIDIERFRCQFLQDGSVSASALDDSGNSARIGTLLLRDVECADCSEVQGLRFEGPSVYSVDGYLAIGIDRARVAFGATAQFSNVLATGVVLASDQKLLPESIENCSIRDVVSRSTKSLGASRIENCIFTDVSNSTSAMLQPSTSALVIDNVAFIRPFSTLLGCQTGATTCSVLRWSLPAGGGEAPRVERVSFVFDAGQASDWKWMSRSHGTNAAVNPGSRLTGILIANHEHPGLATASLGTSLADLDVSGGGFCFDMNENDGDNAAINSLPPASTSIDVPLGFVDPAMDRWDVTPGSVADTLECGVRRGVDAPGNRGYRWIHAISGLTPELLADDDDEDGIPTDSMAASCVGGNASGCSDNCPDVFNPDQADADADSIGDACDSPCDDGLDNDGDGAIDFPADPGCRDVAWSLEDPACDDDIDNEGYGDGTDWDGGSGGDAADPQCVGRPWRRFEQNTCGLGAELLGLPVLGMLVTRCRRRRAGTGGVIRTAA